MKIGVYDLQTANLTADRPGRDSDSFFSQLEKALGQPLIHGQPDELASCDLPLVFIGGGGSEGFFLPVSYTHLMCIRDSDGAGQPPGGGGERGGEGRCR